MDNGYSTLLLTINLWFSFYTFFFILLELFDR